MKSLWEEAIEIQITHFYLFTGVVQAYVERTMGPKPDRATLFSQEVPTQSLPSLLLLPLRDSHSKTLSYQFIQNEMEIYTSTYPGNDKVNSLWLH